MEKVIQIFRSRLFSALLDIQEYYELTLLDERRVDSQNVAEMVTSRVVDRKPTPINHQNNHVAPRYNNVGANELEEPLPPPPPELLHNNNNGVKSRSPQSLASHGSSNRTAAPDKRAEYDENWEYDDVTLERGTTGLGFSIAGGTDNPHVGNDPSIFITKLIEGGTAMRDGRLKVNDVIVSVNDVPTENVTHAQSVDALKRAGNTVHLIVRRPKAATETIMEVQMKKGSRGLGFSIGGGSDNQHISGDNAIYITKIIDGGTAQEDGRLEMGDKLIAVNDVYLNNVTHDEAVAALKATKDTVRFIIAKPVYSELNGDQADSLPRSPTQSQASASYSVSRTAAAAAARSPDKSPELNVARGPRKIVLKKGTTGLGFNIVGGEDGEGIFVSFILAGGQADRSGALFRGDQLLTVNGIDLRDATHEQAAAVLKGSGDVVEIMAEHRPNEYNRFEAKIHDLREQMMNSTTGSLLTLPSAASSVKMSNKKTLYVKALFDCDAELDKSVPGRGLSFNYGDILHVTNANDDDWWQAQKVLPEEDIIGVIPSKQRVEKRERTRLKSVKLNKNKKKKGKKSDVPSDDEALENIRSYVTVISKPLRITRPVIILGPLKDRINDDLITDFPDRFASCIPHTTRPRRANEVDGRDYHFVASRDQMERDIENHLFIEAGQFSENLYGTHVQSVRDIAEGGKHCILDVSGTAIKRLEEAELYPITILVRPDSFDLIRQWDDVMTEEQARKAFEKMTKIEEEFGDQFTSVVSGNSADDVYAIVKDVIKEQSGSAVWIAADTPEQ